MSDTVLIFDTTLRDGEQSPGASLLVNDKVEIAHALVKLGVDIIEAGFPVSSPAQFTAVQRVAEECATTIAALARSKEEDISAAGKALAPAKKRRIHTFVGTSDYHVMAKFGDSKYGVDLKNKRQTVLKMVQDSILQAKQYTDDIEFSAEDAFRTDVGFLTEVALVAYEAGATTLNLPDTTGYAHPDHYSGVFRIINEKLAGKKLVLSTHCHNDLGLAVANSLAAVQAGARQVECSINGIGERAGNASLEEIVMALKIREDFFKKRTNINTQLLFPTSQLVSARTGLMVQPNKAIVGSNAFAHESGIHQDGMIKNRKTYEIIEPESVGVQSTRLVLGKHSGQHGLKVRLEALGFRLDKEQLKGIYQKFLLIADQKKEVTDQDLQALMQPSQEIKLDMSQLYQFKKINLNLATGSPSAASIVMLHQERALTGNAFGSGPIEACFEAINSVINLNPVLEGYSVISQGGTVKATGEAQVKLRFGSPIFIGVGSSVDILEASVKAYIDACNQYLSFQQQRSNVATSVETSKQSLAW